MVSYKEIQASNALLRATKTLPVAIFVGGTSGIGKSAIKALVATGATTKIYLIGRKSSEKSARAFIQEQHSLNSRADIVWIEAEIALLAETNRVCKEIKARESRVDLLFMTAGYAPFSARKETTEGLEVTQSLEYYSRVLFTQLLIPLMQKLEAPRVVSVLAGGMEPATIESDDMDLKEAANFGGFKAQGHYAAMNTMTMEKLAETHSNVTFIHSFPGWVSTGNHRRGADANTVLGRFIWPIFDPLIGLLSSTSDDSGQRHLFESTSAFYGGRGVKWTGQMGLNSFEKRSNGLFLVNQKCDCTPNGKAVRSLRETAKEKIWIHTQEVLGPFL